eukprot:4626892-Alexandrium_andersonii.AAC.1
MRANAALRAPPRLGQRSCKVQYSRVQSTANLRGEPTRPRMLRVTRLATDRWRARTQANVTSTNPKQYCHATCVDKRHVSLRL